MESKYYAIYNGCARLGHMVMAVSGRHKGSLVHRHYKFTSEQAAAYLRMNPKARAKETKTGDLFDEKANEIL